MIYRKSDPESANIASDLLKRGEIVILPTDTVYGFSGIVDNINNTDKKIRMIKGREKDKPFIQLIASPDDLSRYTADVIPKKIISLWPGPLTIIVTDFYQSTTAFRCPGDDWLRSIIEKCGSPIYSTSVNRSGMPVLNIIDQIEKEFSEDVSLIVSDGDKLNGIPSTMVKIENGDIKVVRQGSIKI